MAQTGPFFTDVDSRAAVKGSRDPLGIQPLWTHLGRHVVGNLTTVSFSVRDFTTTMMGMWFVEQVAEIAPKQSEVETFLKWEQLAAYARVAVNDDGSIRGIDRVRRALSDGNKVIISAERVHQILSDQKTYGLWGLYTGPARVSGLVDSASARLTPEANEFVEKFYLSKLTQAGFPDGKGIAKRLTEPSQKLDLNGKDQAFIGAIASLLKRRILAAERPFYQQHLAWGGPRDATKGLQRELAELLVLPPFDDKEFYFTPKALVELSKQARKHNDGESDLAQKLDRIRYCESLVAPAARIFAFLLSRETSTVEEVAKTMRETLGKSIQQLDPDRIAELEPLMITASGNKDVAARWVNLAHQLHSGDYAQAIRTLIQQNDFVMKSRKGSAWIEECEGRLAVRFRADSGRLPDAEELPNLWIYSYFLNSLRSVALVLKEK